MELHDGYWDTILKKMNSEVLILNALFGWWWADPLASLVIVYYGISEGLHAWRGEKE